MCQFAGAVTRGNFSLNLSRNVQKRGIAVARTVVLHCVMGLPATHKTATEEDRGEDSDWLIGQSIARQVARGEGGGVTVRNAEKVDKIVAIIVAKRRIKFYFLQRLWQQQHFETSCCLGVVHLANFGTTCVVTKLRDKLDGQLPRATAS